MRQIRYGVFETNSSSTHSLVVMIVQTQNLDIPSTIRIDTRSGESFWDNTPNGFYNLLKDEGQEQKFLNLLARNGVREIYVDGQLVETNPNDCQIKGWVGPDIIARCFGDYKVFGTMEPFGDDYEWAYGNEDYPWDLKLEEVKTIQEYAKNSDYDIICTDRNDNIVDWNSLPYSKLKITDDMIENERLARQYRKTAREEEIEEPDEIEESPYSDIQDNFDRNRRRRRKY